MIFQLILVALFTWGFWGSLSWLAYLAGGLLLIIDIVLMLKRDLKPHFPLICYLVGAIFVRPWYLGILAGSAAANLIELPRVFISLKQRKRGFFKYKGDR